MNKNILDNKKGILSSSILTSEQTYIYKGRIFTAEEIEKEEKKFLKNNYITIPNKSYKCEICVTYRAHFEKIKEHIFSEEHQALCKSIINFNNRDKSNNTSFPPLNSIKEASSFQKFYEANNLCTPIPQITEARFCSACDLFIYQPEEIVIHNMLHLHEEYNLDGMDIIRFYHLDHTLIRECIMCQEKFHNDRLLANHLSTDKHKKCRKECKAEIKNLSSKSNYLPADIKKLYIWENTFNLCKLFFCSLCSKFIAIDKLQDHCKEEVHQNYVMKSESLLFNDTFVKPLIPLFFCFICNKSFDTKNDLFLHIKMYVPHKNSMTWVNTSNSCGLLSVTTNGKVENTDCTYGSLEQLYVPNAIKPTKSHSLEDLKYQAKEYVAICIEKEKRNVYTIDQKIINNLALGLKLSYEEGLTRFCMICLKKFPKNFEALYEHLFSVEHHSNLSNANSLYKRYSFKQNSCRLSHLADYLPNLFEDMWYYSQNFYCELCSFKTDLEYEFAKHILYTRHKKDGLEFYFCYTCTLLGCGVQGSNTFAKHSKNILHEHWSEKSALEVPDFSEIFTQINNRIYDLKIESDRVCNDENQKLLLDSIEETVQFSFPDATAYMFGSRLSKLGLQNSIVHVYLDCYGTYATSQSHAKSKSLLFGTENYFEYDDQHWIIEDTLIKSKEPTLKLKHKSTKLSCHISFSSGLNVEKSILIGKFNEVYPKCREMILFLKKWLSGCNLSGSSLIATYSVSWLVIFYLQTQNIFPSTYDLLKLGKKSHLVGGWDCGFVEKIPINETKGSEYSTTELIKGFFLYYSVFDYKLKVICPFLGREVKKSHFANLEKLPQEMQIYASQMATEDFHFESPLCIQDPVHLTENITRALEKKDLLKLRKFCVEGLKCTY